MDTSTLFKLSYGLYLLTTECDGKDNGCIINTVMQVTSSNVCMVSVSKQNHTNDMIMKSEKFNVSVLTNNTPFEVIEHFGFKSGKSEDKFADYKHVERSANGILYLAECVNAYLSFEVKESFDFGSHMVYKCEIVGGETISDAPSLTYDYYHRYIKPAPQAAAKDGYRCIICGYVYEGDVLPDDYICPLCKHGASDFAKIKKEERIMSAPNLKGTKTEKNLQEAFAGESMARNKYTYFASKAKNEGYEQIAALFEETALNEREHAKIWFKLLCDGDIPATADNLAAAAKGENEEWTDMYKRMASEAKEEGFEHIAFLFEQVGNIEKDHEERYLKLLENMKNSQIFAKNEKSVWICRNCGYIADAQAAPGGCPVCVHPQAYFELRSVNY